MLIVSWTPDFHANQTATQIKPQHKSKIDDNNSVAQSTINGR